MTAVIPDVLSASVVLQVVFTAEDLEDLGWQDQAFCAQTDPEAFFPDKAGSTREAKRVCSGCEVRAACLAGFQRLPGWPLASPGDQPGASAPDRDHLVNTTHQPEGGAA